MHDALDAPKAHGFGYAWWVRSHFRRANPVKIAPIPPYGAVASLGIIVNISGNSRLAEGFVP